MSVSMLLLMAYGLVGEAAHEWIGMRGMFALFVAQPYTSTESGCWQSERANTRPSAWFRRRWSESSFLSMSGSMISGVVLSRYVFAFFPKHGGYELAQQVHILCAYWGFVVFSCIWGFTGARCWRWRVFASPRLCGHGEPATDWLVGQYMARVAFRTALVCICCSEATSYSTIIPIVILFLIDYLSVMVMFVC